MRGVRPIDKPEPPHPIARFRAIDLSPQGRGKAHAALNLRAFCRHSQRRAESRGRAGQTAGVRAGDGGHYRALLRGRLSRHRRPRHRGRPQTRRQFNRLWRLPGRFPDRARRGADGSRHRRAGAGEPADRLAARRRAFPRRCARRLLSCCRQSRRRRRLSLRPRLWPARTRAAARACPIFPPISPG